MTQKNITRNVIMKRIFLFPTLSLLICISSFAWASSSLKPRCPSVEAIKKSTFNTVKHGMSETSWFVIEQNNKYDTDAAWDFFVYILDAENENIARKKA